MPAFPTPVKVEVEFVAGAWTDVTDDVDFRAGIQIRFGRSSEFSDPQVATCDLQLRNPDGRYTPKTALLNDGTANPLWPDVKPRKRLRVWLYATGPSSDQRFLFVGYIKAWQPLQDNGIRAYVAISAADRGDQLSRVSTRAPAVQSMLADHPALCLPFDEPEGSTSFFDVAGDRVAHPVLPQGNGTVTAGVENPVPFPDGLTGVKIEDAGEWVVFGGTLTNGFANNTTKGISLPAAANTAWTVESWMTVEKGATAGYAELILFPLTVGDITQGEVQIEFIQQGTGKYDVKATYFDSANETGVTITNAAAFGDDGTPHHVAVTGSDDGTDLQLALYVDGFTVVFQTATAGGGTFGTRTDLILAGDSSAAGVGTAPVTFGPTAVHASTLDAPRIFQHAKAGGLINLTGLADNSTSARVAEYLYWGGVAEQDLAVGVQEVTLNIPTAGKNVLQACQEMAATESGGSVFWVGPDGNATFRNRVFRPEKTDPDLVFDAQADIDGGSWAPTFDELSLVNTATVQRGDGASQTFTDRASVDEFGESRDTGTTVYTADDLSALNIAQYRVASNRQPGYRLGQFTVDIVKADGQAQVDANATTLWQALDKVVIGSRVRVPSIPVGAAPRSSLDVYVEGWAATVTDSALVLTFDTSPADNPPWALWGTGRWRPDAGTTTLTADIGGDDTSVSVTGSGLTLTTTSGSYPLDIQIDEEVLTVTAAPSSATSPQTLTVIRGQQHTRAAEHAAGATVDLYPYVWSL